MIFDWGGEGVGPTHKSHAMMSSEIFKIKTFLGAKISSNGRSEGMPGLALYQHFAKGEGLNQYLKNANV